MAVLADWVRLRLAVSSVPDYLQRFRSRVAWEVLWAFKLSASADLARAAMAIVHNEYDPSRDLTDQIGDLESSVGPSIGPMQVSRGTAKALGLWTPSGTVDEALEYAALASTPGWAESTGIAWGVAVFRDKLAHASGTWDAVRRYNGSGPDAQAYLERAQAFAGGQGWVFA